MITPQRRLELAHEIAHEAAIKIVNNTEAQPEKLGWIETLIQSSILAAFRLEAVG